MVESWLRSTGLCLPPLIRERGHRYVLFTQDPALYPTTHSGEPHPVIDRADEIVRVDTNDLDAVTAAALDLAERLPVHGVLTTCDYYLETAAVIAARLGLPGAPPEVMHRATRKHLVRSAISEAGLANPAFAVAASWESSLAAAAAIGYPLVAKPVDLNAGTSVQRVDDEAGLKDAFWEITGVERNTRGQPLSRLLLLEELIEGPEFSVEAVTRDGETAVIGITDKSITGPPAFVESGHMFPARLTPAAASTIEEFTRDALAAIGYTHGLSHTELRLTPDGPRIIEINPRQAGGYIFDLVRLVTGSHPLELLVDLSLGKAPQIGSERATAASAAVFFVMSPRPGTVIGVDGAAALDADTDVVRWHLPTPATAGYPRSNDAYLGHVLAVDATGGAARERAEAAVGSLRLRFADGSTATPIGLPG